MTRPSHNLRQRTGFLVLLASLSFLAMGCREGTSTVTGQVTYKKLPVKRGTVTFFCADGQIVFGLIGPDGHYTIPNVPKGEVRVAVVTHPSVPRGFSIPQQLPPSKDAPRLDGPSLQKRGASESIPVLPERYHHPDRSGLRIQVEATAQQHDIHLDS